MAAVVYQSTTKAEVFTLHITQKYYEITKYYHLIELFFYKGSIYFKRIQFTFLGWLIMDYRNVKMASGHYVANEFSFKASFFNYLLATWC